MTSLNTAEQRLVDLPDFEAPAIRQAPDGVELFPITADGGLTMEIRGGLLKNDRIIVSCTAEPGSHKDASYTSVSLPVTTDGRRVVNLPLSIIAFNLGQTITFKYEVERGGEKKDSASLVLNVLPIPPERLPMPRALDADEGGEVWDLREGRHDRTIRLNTWPLIAPGQYVNLQLVGDSMRVGVLQEEDTAEPWGTNAYRDVQVRFQHMKHFPDGTRVELRFSVIFNQIATSSPKRVNFPVRTYTIRTNKLAPLEIVSMTDSKGIPVVDEGSTTDPWLTIVVKGEANEEFLVNDNDHYFSSGVFDNDGTWSNQLDRPLSVGKHRLVFAHYYYHTGSSKSRTITVEAPSKT